MKKSEILIRLQKLKHYKENYIEFIYSLNNLSWWGKRKFKKFILKSLPVKKEGKGRYNWKIDFIYEIDEDIYSKKEYTKKIVDIYIHTKFLNCNHKYYKYDIESGCIVHSVDGVCFDLEEYI